MTGKLRTANCELQIEERVFDQMQAHSIATRDVEACGFIYRDLYVPLANTNEGKRDFQAHPAEIARALHSYGEPLAIFHTHPNGTLEPSATDLAHHYYRNSKLVIGALSGGSLLIRTYYWG